MTKRLVCTFVVALFLVGLVQCAGVKAVQKWDKPTWNVGDKLLWIEGSYTMDDVMRASDLDSTTYQGYDYTGTFTWHAYLTVEKDDAMKNGSKCYQISVDILMDLDMDMDSTIMREGYTTSYKIGADLSMGMNGNMFLTTDKIAFASMNMAMNIDMAMNMELDTNDPMFDNLTFTDIALSGKITTTQQVTASPPIDIFDFPVAVGEHWNTTASSVRTVSSMSGFMETTINGTKNRTEFSGPEYNYDQTSLSDPIPLWCPDDRPNPTTVTIGGKEFRVFIIELDISAFDIGLGLPDTGMQQPLSKGDMDIMATAGVPEPSGTMLYYSPDENKFLGLGLTDSSGGVIIDSTKLVSTKTDSGTSTLLAISAVAVIALIVVIVVIVLLFRRKKIQAAPAQPYTQAPSQGQPVQYVQVQPQQVQYVQQPPQQTVTYQQSPQQVQQPQYTTPQQKT